MKHEGFLSSKSLKSLLASVLTKSRQSINFPFPALRSGPMVAPGAAHQKQTSIHSSLMRMRWIAPPLIETCGIEALLHEVTKDGAVLEISGDLIEGSL
jgi:hypothetical protein